MQIRNFSLAAVGWVFLLFSNTVMAWTVDDNYDNQSNGQRCGSFWGDQSDSVVSDQNSSSGSKSCKMSIAQGTFGWGGGFVLPSSLKKGDEFWMRFRLFLPAGFDYNVTGDYSNKFIRFDIKDTSNVGSFLDWKWENEGQPYAYAGKLQRDNCTTNCWQYFGSNNQRPVRGIWETYEIYVKFDNVQVDSGGQGRIRAWKNGVLVGDLTGRRTMNNAGDIVKSALLFSYWNNGSPKTQHLFLDDLVATNVRPAATDSQGNPYIGVGNFVALVAPLPPSSIQ